MYLSSNFKQIFTCLCIYSQKTRWYQHRCICIRAASVHCRNIFWNLYIKKHLPQQLIHIFQTINYNCICNPGISLGCRLCFIQREWLRAISPVTLLSIKHFSCSKYKSSCSSSNLIVYMQHTCAVFIWASYGKDGGSFHYWKVKLQLSKWTPIVLRGVHSKVMNAFCHIGLRISLDKEQLDHLSGYTSKWNLEPKNPHVFTYLAQITYKIATKSLILCIIRVSNIK